MLDLYIYMFERRGAVVRIRSLPILLLKKKKSFSVFQKVRVVQEDVGKKAPTIWCRHFILGHPKQKNKTLAWNLVITIKIINSSICSDIEATRRIGQKEQ
jgi:hypothetical protein